MLVELGVVEQRYRAVLEVVEDGAPATEVARRYGVARQTGTHNYPLRGIEPENDRSGGCGPGFGLGGYPLEVQSRPDSCAPGPAVDSDLLSDIDGGGETAAARA